MINLSDVTVEYFETVPETKQMPEFYATGGSKDFAVITKGDREVRVAVNGEMDLVIPNLINGELSDDDVTRIRYGDEFEELFKDDVQFWQFLKTLGFAGYQVYRMNPWWEAYDEFDSEGGVYDTFYEAIEGAISTVLDDEYWNQ